MGSRDRKLTAHLCYCYFRAGKLFTASPDPDILLATLFLCSRQPHELLTALRPEWAASLNLPTEAKLAMVMPGAGADHLFPWKEELSEGIDPVPLVASLTEQPDLFLRLRPGSEAVVTRKLQAANIPFTPINKQTLALPNGVVKMFGAMDDGSGSSNVRYAAFLGASMDGGGHDSKDGVLTFTNATSVTLVLTATTDLKYRMSPPLAGEGGDG